MCPGSRRPHRNRTSSRTYQYDSLGRQNQLTILIASTSRYTTTTYDSISGKMSSVQAFSGFAVVYAYNATGYLWQIDDAVNQSTVYWQANARDAELHLTSQTQGIVPSISTGLFTAQSFDPQTGRQLNVCATTNTATCDGAVANLSTDWDPIGNLLERDDTITGSSETFQYDRLNRLTNAPFTLAGTTTPHGVSYDSLGDITKKVGLCGYVGCMVYGAPGHLHAVSSVATSSGVTYDGLAHANLYYDANGNLQCVTSLTSCNPATDAKSFTPTSFNMASKITQGTTILTLTYDPEHNRSQQGVAVNGGGTVTTSYYNDPNSNVISETIHVPNPNGKTLWKTYIVADGKILAQRITTNGQSGVTMNYFVLDHLGSVAVVFDGTLGAVSYNTVIARQFFDAWGAMRNQDGTADTTCSLPAASPSTRGYTNQEEMPSVCLVNYNARIYDPALGRFLSADPMVESVYYDQDLNRYSYVGNNPLSFNDPSGRCFLGCFWKQSWFGALLDIGLFFVGLPELEVGFQLGISAAFTAASAAGFAVINAGIAGGISGFVSTGKLSGALLGAAQGVATVGLAPGLGAGLGSAIGNATIGSAIAQGLVGGLFSAAGGGNFGSGFLAGGVGSLAGPLFGGGAFDPGKMLGSAALGGFASVLGGGKFANGAITGAFAYAATSISGQRTTASGSTTQDLRLSFTTVVNDSVPGQVGIWTGEWQLSGPAPESGIVMQHVVDSIVITWPDGTTTTSTYEYWETWDIAAGHTMTTNAENGNPYDDSIQGGALGEHGSFTAVVDARFYAGQATPSGFIENNPLTLAGGLPSSIVDPDLPTDNATPSVNRNWNFHW